MRQTGNKGGIYFRVNLLKRIDELYNFFFLMFLSGLFAYNPAYGGALYVSGLAVINFSEIYGARYKDMNRKQKTALFILIPPAILVLVYLAFVYPVRFYTVDVIFIIAAVAVVLLRTAADRLIKRNIYKLLAYVSLVLVYVPLMVSFSDSMTGVAVPAGFLTGCAISYFRNAYITRHGISTTPFNRAGMRAARGINSYRLYVNMIVVVTSALQITAMMYMSYMRYVTETNLIGNFLNSYLVTIAAIVVLIANAAFLQKKVKLEHYEKTLIFVIAAASCVLAGVNIYNSGAKLTMLSTYLNLMVFITGISFIFLILSAMQEDFRDVLALGRQEMRNVGEQIRHLDRLSVFVAYYAVMLMLVSLCIIPGHQTGNVDDPGVFTKLVTFYMLIIPAVFIFIGLIYSVRQPLTLKYSEKLRQFKENIRTGRKNPHLEKLLDTVLVKKYKTRFGIKIIAFILYPLLKHKVEGVENVTEKDPAVFVCNHKEIYGPVVTNLYMPYVCRPWIISGMVVKEKISDHLMKSYNIRKWPHWMKRMYCRAMGPVLHWAMNSVEPIPVYRNSGRDILKTIKMTVEAMEQQDNILLFPEDPSKTNGYTDKPGDFFTGFAHIGKAYHKKTGKTVMFYPVFADSDKRIIFIGKGIRFNPSENQAVERDRIVLHLQEAMHKMASS